MSVGTLTGYMNPSLQNPPEHFCPLGQTLFARHGNLASPHFQLPKLRSTVGFDS